MFSHGFMSFAAIGISVACLLIMGTFTLVAYNANENLSDLQQENAVVAFVDDSLTETQARDLQAQLEKAEKQAQALEWLRRIEAAVRTAQARQLPSVVDFCAPGPVHRCIQSHFPYIASYPFYVLRIFVQYFALLQ